MTMDQIENILRKAPTPKAPEELLQRLTTGVRLPRTSAATVDSPDWGARPSWLWKWLPAVSFAAIFLVCLAVIAVQSNTLAELERGNNDLRAAKTKLEAARTENPANQEAVIENQGLEGLRKDNAELLKLRAEVGRLQAQLQDGPKLRAENAQIKAAIAANQAAADLDADALAKAKARAERIACVNNLKQIGLAMRIWANDHNDISPANFICMTNELSTWKILQCPSDKGHHVTNWAEVEAGNISYIMDAPGIAETNYQAIFAECPIHHNVCLMDGSVQQLSEEGYKKCVKIVDGTKVFVNAP
jgi:hypothetical protein